MLPSFRPSAITPRQCIISEPTEMTKALSLFLFQSFSVMVSMFSARPSWIVTLGSTTIRCLASPDWWPLGRTVLINRK